ncbi:MAG: PadR family transcriptional regulator [Acidobacteria bacterium]|nr:PadR family transcriptional regulator [Acidobacteriota bacterium]
MTYGAPPTRTPLKPAVFHILLALSQGQLHGLAIADSVEAETEGDIRLGPGTLYRSLKEMSEAGLVAQVTGEAADPRRKVYELTENGRTLVQVEAERLARVLEVARSRHVLGGGGQ